MEQLTHIATASLIQNFASWATPALSNLGTWSVPALSNLGTWSVPVLANHKAWEMPLLFWIIETGYFRAATVPMEFVKVLFPPESAEFFFLLATTNFILWFVYGGWI